MAKLTQEEWIRIHEIQAAIGHIFATAKTERVLCMTGGVLHVPVCCWPGKKGYAEIIEMKRRIRAIQKGNDEDKSSS
jgi:hypothetical protein